MTQTNRPKNFSASDSSDGTGTIDFYCTGCLVIHTTKIVRSDWENCKNGEEVEQVIMEKWLDGLLRIKQLGWRWVGSESDSLVYCPTCLCSHGKTD